MASSTAHQVPFFEEANDETGSVVGGTKVSASPRKEKPNTSRSRREKLSSLSSDSSTLQTDSDQSTPPVAVTPKRSKDSRPREREARAMPRDKEKARDSHRDWERDRERDRHREHVRDERPKNARTVTIQAPDTIKRSKPALHASSTSESQDAYRRPKGTIPDNPAHYGISPGMSRPRTSSRPSSYYGAGSRPPAANERWHAMQQNQPSQPHPFAPSYGASPFAQPPPPLPLPPAGYHMPPSPTNDYFNMGAVGGPVGSMSGTPTQHLASRFAMQRPSSASGYRQQPPPSLPPTQQYDEYYEDEHYPAGGLVRRPSVSRKEVEDRRQMPPPPFPRPMTAGPKPGGPFRPPPQMVQPRHITHYKYDDDELETADSGLYREMAPSRSISYSYGENNAPQRRTRQGSTTYDDPAYQIETATSTSRRHSFYGSSAGSVDYEDQMRRAEAYQGKVSGSQVPLTKETLGKVGRPKRSSDKSSRSTRSSASRDESDFWNSNTTRTTRSMAGDGETSIRIKGGATLRVGELEIQCQDGEIIINQDGSTRGSDRGSTVWGDERPAPRQIDNVPYRPRAASQAASYSRKQLPGSYDGYAERFG